MKILLIRTNGNLVNFSTYNLQEVGLAKAFIRNGMQCDIVYYGADKDTHVQELIYNNNVIKIFWTKGFSILENGFFFGLKKMAKEYDIIQVSEYDQVTSIFLAFFSQYRKKVYIYHGPYLCEYNEKYKVKCQIIDRIPLPRKRKECVPCFAKSIFARDFLYQRGFKNIVITGVGLDTDRFSKKSIIDIKTKDIINRIQSKFVLLYVGRIEKRRNTMFLIELVRKLKSEVRNFCLLIIGDGDEEYVLKCKDLIKKYNLNELICWVNKVEQSQLPHIYENSNIFLLPTSYEIFGMVMLESMFYSLPIITTRHGGSETVINNGTNGFVCKLEINEWCSKIKELYNEPQLCKFIGQNATYTINKDFTWDVIAKKMQQTYIRNLVN